MQRLGALYSNTENLSSPIHRNESRFDDEQLNAERKSAPVPKARFAKLRELANSVNSWEDEATSSDNKDHSAKKPTNEKTNKTNEPKIVGVCPRKNESPKKLTNNFNDDKTKPSESVKNRQLHWDKNVMNALEQQGFKRRDTTTSRLVYDYKDDNKINNKPTTTTATKSTLSTKPAKTIAEPAKKIDVSRGLVSGRAAIFENSAQAQGAKAKQQKDPAEMSLKERMALFERNKGTALIPKAALGMAPSVKQIMADQKHENSKTVPTTSANTTPTKPQSASKINSYNKPVMADSNAGGAGIRHTVAALLSNTTTISESQISSEVKKAREQEMNILLNRFNKPEKDVTESPERMQSKYLTPSAPSLTPSPPPAPPMPSNLFNSANSTKCNHKRRSGKYSLSVILKHL